jgi:L,D-transpeptidase YcbB
MKKILFTASMLFATFASGIGGPSGSIKQFIDNKIAGVYYEVDNEFLLSGNVLPLFYVNRLYSPAWFSQDIFSSNGYALLDCIRHSDQQGLQPNDYHLNLIDRYLGRMRSDTLNDKEDIMKLDILLTDAFMLLASDLYYGKVDQNKEGSNWKMQRKEPDLRLDLKLEEALANSDMSNELNMLAPRYHSYWMMKKELAFFLDLDKNSWPVIKSDLPVKPRESNPLVSVIRQRLIKLRYQLSDSVSLIYDPDLEKQIKAFQNDWGLNPDGVIGKTTLEVINSAPAQLINKLKVNMERFRWLPLQLTEKYIIVNIANFELDLIKGSDTLISMRAIVGKECRRTPIFNDRISYIVFNPSWTVPPTILREDVIPQLLKGPEYLEKNNMRLLRNDGSELAYSDVDWSKISTENFPYQVRQNPGPANALGRVSFMFPNAENVYIHDTPSRGYFAREDRAISSGCIRVEKPFDLAALLLSDNPDWSPAHIREAINQEKEETVRLKIPVEVVLIYLTAWTDGKDRVQFRKDVYQTDDTILEALNQKPESNNVKTIL